MHARHDSRYNAVIYIVWLIILGFYRTSINQSIRIFLSGLSNRATSKPRQHTIGNIFRASLMPERKTAFGRRVKRYAYVCVEPWSHRPTRPDSTKLFCCVELQEWSHHKTWSRDVITWKTRFNCFWSRILVQSARVGELWIFQNYVCLVESRRVMWQ